MVLSKPTFARPVFVLRRVKQTRTPWRASHQGSLRDVSVPQANRPLRRCQWQTSPYLRAIKQFSRWLVKDRRTAVDALQHLAGGNVATDRRLERRELTDGELRLLLNSARTGKPSLGLTGWQRFTLYATAVGTGL